MLLIGSVGTLIFFYKFPDGRYGASYILISLFVIFINFFEKLSLPKSIKEINKSLVNNIITFMFCNDLFELIQIIFIAWPNIYDLNNPNNVKLDFNFVEKNFFFSSSDNLKIVHKNLCAYNIAPCTPTKNYLNQFNIDKNKFGYITLKLKK